MTDAIAKAEQLAAERTKYASLQPDTLVPKSSALELAKSEYVAGYLAGRTITADELETAAKRAYKACHSGSLDVWEHETGYLHQSFRQQIRAAFEAVGFTVEGGE